MRTLSRPTWLAIGAAYLLFVLHSLLIRQRLLVGIVFPALLLAIGYLCWRAGRVVLFYDQQLQKQYAAGELTEDEFERAIQEQLTDGNTGTGADSEEQSLSEQEGAVE